MRARFAKSVLFGFLTAVFRAADTDGDGVVSHEEWEAYKESLGYEEGAHE